MRTANEDVSAPNNNPLGMTADNKSVKRLSQEVMEHPLFEHSVLLETPPINDVFRVVKRVVLLRENGCVFTGESGIGKTDAIARVKAMLHKDFPRLCIFTHDAHNQQISSIRAFFKHFLSTVGQREQKGETYDLRSRLVRIIVDDARISGMKLVVIFIDEANAMHLNDFNFLKDVYNDLSKEGIQLLTVLMGQAPDMQHVIDDLRVKGRNDLVGRFAMRVHQMRGFSSVEDVQVIFRSIDRRNLVDFFLPKACKSGFRLENESQNFFDAIALAVTSSPDVAITFPARQTFLAIRAFLLDASEFDAEEIKLPKNVWHDAVAYSQLQDAIIRMNGRNSPKAKTPSQMKKNRNP